MPNAFAHVELNTDHLGRASKFYGQLFKWKIAPYDGDGDYLAIDAGKGRTGGGMQVNPMPEAPNAWLPYVEVDSVKRTIARAKKLGATVVVPYQPIGELGAIGIFVDPSGAALGVWETRRPAKRAKKK